MPTHDFIAGATHVFTTAAPAETLVAASGNGKHMLVSVRWPEPVPLMQIARSLLTQARDALDTDTLAPGAQEDLLIRIDAALAELPGDDDDDDAAGSEAA